LQVNIIEVLKKQKWNSFYSYRFRSIN